MPLSIGALTVLLSWVTVDLRTVTL
uniref:Uncharacterized protein n=1 Tax=Arundo donax TaxID=35708 RepID=A0A0A9FR58_ARUDO